MISFSDKLALYSQKPSSEPKIKVNKSDISLTFIMYKKAHNTMVFVYTITIFRYRDIEGKLITDIKNKDVDMASLKKAVLDYLYKNDLKYIDIDLLTTKKVEFSLKEEWYEEAMGNLSPVKTFNIFKKDFRLKIPVPFIVKTTCINTKLWNDLVIEKLRKYFKENQIKKHFSFFNLVNRMFSFTTYFDLFDWSYSPIYNIIEGSMKSKWIVLILIGTNKLLNKDNNNGDNK